tara:strand:- start:589 stop:1551 length:963 start_codon:yes stop_codon:yes gene_type:complete
MKKIIIFCLLLFSCEKVVDLNIAEHTPMLVVNGMLDTDSIPSIFISSSQGAFSNNPIPGSILDANVLLYEDNMLLGEMMLDPNYVDTFMILEDNWYAEINTEEISYYTYDINPKAGSVYSIDVSHTDYESVYATTMIPNNIELIDFNIIDNATDTSTYNATLNIVYQDNPNQSNYYRIRLFLQTEGDSWDEEGSEYELVRKRYPLILYSNDPSLSQGIPWDGYTFSGRTALFNDNLFNGQEKEISFDMEYKLAGIEYGDSLFLQFTSFSEEAYNYFNSIELNRDQFVSPFGTEPVPVFSNVENGIGLFAGGNSMYFQILP